MNFILSTIISFGLCFILTPFTIYLAKKYNFVDDPKKHHHPAILHKKTMPRAGGLPIFLGFTLTLLLIVGISKQVVGIILGGLILVLVGLADDKYDLTKKWKFLAQILAAIVVVGSGIGITFITNPFFYLGIDVLGIDPVIRLDTWRIVFDFLGTHSILVWADLLALFWIIWVVNMVNFSAGVDGQMPGIVFITLLVIFAASLRFISSDSDQIIVANLSLIGAGATLGFLAYNFYPAKIFPGDSGSYLLGYLVAVCAILSGAKIGTAILVMAIPLSDGAFTIIRRISAGQSPFKGDKKHLHHRLLELGWNQRQVALFYWLVCAILGAAALSLASVEKVFAVVVVAVILLGGLIWLNMNLPLKAQK